MSTPNTNLSLDDQLQLAMITTEDHVAEARALIARGATAYTIDDLGQTLLHMAAHGGNIANVTWLVETYNLDIMALDDNNNTPAHTAAMLGQIDMIFWLAAHGADITIPNSYGQTVRGLLLEHNYQAQVAQFDEHFGAPSEQVLVTDNLAQEHLPDGHNHTTTDPLGSMSHMIDRFLHADSTDGHGSDTG